MGKAIVILPCGVIVGLVLLGVWVVSSPRSAFRLPWAEKEEAVYRGKPTSFWLAQLQNRDASFRQQAIQALQLIGPKDERVVPALAGMLKDRIKAVRMGAAFALRKLGSEAKAAVPSLIDALQDEDPFVRLNAACALGCIQPQEEEVIAALIPLLKDESTLVRVTILRIFSNLGHAAKAALLAVREALTDTEAEVRREASEALAKIEGSQE